MFASKPIIGLAGGVGSGKSFVAQIFAEFGALVIASDEQVHRAYGRDDVKATLRRWWGDGVFAADGSVDRKAVAKIVFRDEIQKRRLEALIHPIVNQQRAEIMAAAGGDSAVKAFVWDIPLLFETGLNRACDAVVFVDAPLEIRQERVKATRGWPAEELTRREILQMPLDKKRSISHYMVSNDGSADVVREQARDVFSRILAGSQKAA
jgi:dephospho-CoA kinase